MHLKNGSGACETEFINYFGITGEVTLLALPDSYIASLHYVTEFDADYRDARLRISVSGVFPRKEGAISITVREVDGSRVSEDHRFELAGGSGPYTASVWVDNPRHWTAEAPHLYVLSAALIVDGVEVETIERRVGFRQVEIQGDEMYVNGQRVKLRGVNFLAYYALSGLYVPPEVEERYLRALKAGNVNYLRTAHFPRTTHFYDLCDRLGFYVESEHSAVWSVRSRRENADRRQRLVAPLREMIERDKSHPSIVFWSIGNECEWDEHFQLMYDHVKKADPSRPVKVSWGTDAVDLYSVHYPSIHQQMGGRNKPTIYDEYCHLLDGKGDNPEQVRFDPGVRDHFGMQVQAYWDKIYRSEGRAGRSHLERRGHTAGGVAAVLGQRMRLGNPRFVGQGEAGVLQHEEGVLAGCRSGKQASEMPRRWRGARARLREPFSAHGVWVAVDPRKGERRQA